MQIQELSSWRTYSKIMENRILIELPENSDFREVEIIILPIKRKNTTETVQEEWKKDFLSISQWDIQEDEVRMKSWHIPEF